MSKSTLYDIANEFEKSLDNLLDHDDSDLIKEIEKHIKHQEKLINYHKKKIDKIIKSR